MSDSSGPMSLNYVPKPPQGEIGHFDQEAFDRKIGTALKVLEVFGTDQPARQCDIELRAAAVAVLVKYLKLT